MAQWRDSSQCVWLSAVISPRSWGRMLSLRPPSSFKGHQCNEGAKRSQQGKYHQCKRNHKPHPPLPTVSLWVFLDLIYWCRGASQVVLVVKNPPANAGDVRDTGSIPESRRCPGGEHSNPLQHSCLENPMGRGAWWATVYRITKIQTQTKQVSTQHTC